MLTRRQKDHYAESIFRSDVHSGIPWFKTSEQIERFLRMRTEAHFGVPRELVQVSGENGRPALVAFPVQDGRMVMTRVVRL